MVIDIAFRDYDTASDLKDGSSCAYGNIHYTGRNQSSVTDPDRDGDARIDTTGFRWWIGCQHAIKLTWNSGEEVILKASKKCKLKNDKEAQKKILDYFRKLIANKFKYMPFDKPEIKFELTGNDVEFMDI